MKVKVVGCRVIEVGDDETVRMDYWLIARAIFRATNIIFAKPGRLYFGAVAGFRWAGAATQEVFGDDDVCQLAEFLVTVTY